MVVLDVAPFPGLVTEDAAKLLLDHPNDFREHYRQFAGKGVLLYLTGERLPVTQNQRGYWNGVIVPVFQEAIGEPSKLKAHKTLLDVLDWLPGDPDPTTSDAGCDRARMSDLLLKACALLTSQGHIVPAPEPDPVRRFLRGARRGAPHAAPS